MSRSLELNSLSWLVWSEMMEFRKCKRDANEVLSGGWRLASVQEVNEEENYRKLKESGIINSWDTARLLDGYVEGKKRAVKQYKGNLEHMIVVKPQLSKQPDEFSREKMHVEGQESWRSYNDFLEQMYSGVDWTTKRGQAAVLFSCEDKITESICLVLYSIVKKFQEDGKRQDELKKLTERLHKEFRNGRTLFHYAVDQPHKPNHGLYVAECLKNNFKTAGEDLIKTADIHGRTALHFAAYHGNTELCELLINEWKMRADETDINKENVLHFAVKGENKDVFNYLCKSPELRRIIASADCQGKTALHKAAAHGSTEMIKTLLSCISMSLEEGERDPLQELRLTFVGQPDMFGQTALLEAARVGCGEAVTLLLGNGSRLLHERNSDGRSALDYAVEISNDEKANAMVELLLKNLKSNQEKSLLVSISATGVGKVKDTLKRNRGNQSLQELLMLAIKLGHNNIAWELIKRGANIVDIKRTEQYIENKQRVDTLLNKLKRINNMAGRSGDQPAIFDSLGRKEFAEGLAALFLNPYVKSPLTVGISGDWGMGKSSLMIQTEIILLKTAAQLAFPNLLDTERFPECRHIEQSRKGQQIYEEINKAVKDLLPSPSSASEDDPLVQFLDGEYQSKYHEVYKLLALRDRNEMFPSKDGDEAADSSSNQYSLRKIPCVLTVQYNAWHYQNELEAWAGLAVGVTKAIEESMTKAQRVRCRCRYAWREHGSKIFLELLLPILLALFLSVWVASAVWELLTISKHKDLQALKYGSVPVTVLVVVWTVVKQLLSVLKPISVQIMGYLQLPNHRTNLGYQHQVISDINFLREEIGEKPSLIWRFIERLWKTIAWPWRFIAWLFGLYPDTVKDASIFRSSPPHKDDIRMIVFVDDLDRCQDKVILQVLSAVNLVLAACNINVVLGMDLKMIERVMKAEFPDNRNPKELAEKYLGKMVQLPLALPDPNEEESKHFLGEQLGPAFEEGLAPEDDESKAPAEQNPGYEQSSADHYRYCVCLNITEVSQSCLSKQSQVFESLRRLKSRLLGCIHGRKKAKGKLQNMSFSMQTIMPNYIMEERIALDYLRKRATGAQRLPREWKRFLIYHRIAWHILYQRKQVQNTQGWQQQLVIWLFCCWQWKDQLDLIIKDWKKLVPFSLNLEDGKDSLESNKASFKSIVEKCYKKKCLPPRHKEEKEENSKEGDEESEEKENEEEKEKKVENDDEFEVENEEFEVENEQWLSLIDTLTRHDVSMECVEFFQKFRLHCQMGNLSTSNTLQQII